MMEKTLTLTFTLNKQNNHVIIDELESESGESYRMVVPFVDEPGKHDEFDERISAEIASWISMWMDELNEEEY